MTIKAQMSFKSHITQSVSQENVNQQSESGVGRGKGEHRETMRDLEG